MSIQTLNWTSPSSIYGEHTDMFVYIPKQYERAQRGKMVCMFALKGEFETHHASSANCCANIGSGWDWERGEDVIVKSGECVDIFRSNYGEIETLTHPEWLKNRKRFTQQVLFYRIKG